MKALILAAGLGTRLGQLTENRPKPMLPIAGKPLLEHTIRWLREYGIRDIAINVHHFPESITGYFGDGRGLDVSIRYSRENQLLGTAGAAKRLQAFLDEPFVAVYGDVLTNLDLDRLLAMHSVTSFGDTHGSVLTMALYAVANPSECGLVELDPTGRVRRFVEKPPPEEVFTDLAFTGIMICEPVALSYIPSDTYFDVGHDLIPALLTNHRPIYAEPIRENEFVIDIGTMPGYLRAQSIMEERTSAVTSAPGREAETRPIGN